MSPLNAATCLFNVEAGFCMLYILIEMSLPLFLALPLTFFDKTLIINDSISQVHSVISFVDQTRDLVEWLRRCKHSINAKDPNLKGFVSPIFSEDLAISKHVLSCCVFSWWSYCSSVAAMAVHMLCKRKSARCGTVMCTFVTRCHHKCPKATQPTLNQNLKKFNSFVGFAETYNWSHVWSGSIFNPEP